MERFQANVRDGVRYILLAISNDTLSMAASSADACRNGPQLIEYIQANWCQGRSLHSILEESLRSMTFKEGSSFNKFTADFTSTLRAIRPVMDCDQMCELFAEKLPMSMDAYVSLADTNPGRRSVTTEENDDDNKLASFLAWARKVNSQVQAHLSRARAREARGGGVAADALQTTSAAETGSCSVARGRRSLCE